MHFKAGYILVCSIAHFVQYWIKSVQYWMRKCAVLKFKVQNKLVLKERSRWNIKSTLPKCLCNKMSKGTNKYWPNICQVPVIIPILNIFMSRKAGVLLSPTRGKSLGTRLSFVSHQRITIGYGWFERVYFFGDTLYVVIMFKDDVTWWRHWWHLL
jgi:hypothetical protein